VEVNWARGRLMREYTVLLDPPVYTPGESARSSAPVTAPSTSATPSTTAAAPAVPAAAAAPPSAAAPAAAAPQRRAAPSTQAAPAAQAGAPGGSFGDVHVGRGDTLTKIARNLQ